MSTAVLFKEQTGETWSLESHHDCVKGFYLAPGAKKPSLTRVPQKLCTDEDPEKHIVTWMERLKSEGFSVDSQDRTPAPSEVSVSWTVEGAVDVEWLPDDLKAIAVVQHGVINIPAGSANPVSMIELASFNAGDGPDSRRPMLTGVITTFNDVVLLLRLAKALQPFGVEVLGLPDSLNANAPGSYLDADDGPERAADWWPALQTKLEEHDLIKVSVKRLEMRTPAKSWFF